MSSIDEEADDLRRSREWYEARDRDDIHAAVNAMCRYLQAGGDAEVTRLQSVVDVGIAELSALAAKVTVTTQAVAEDEDRLSTARTAESNAAEAYNRNKQHFEDLASFAESETFRSWKTMKNAALPWRSERVVQRHGRAMRANSPTLNVMSRKPGTARRVNRNCLTARPA